MPNITIEFINSSFLRQQPIDLKQQPESGIWTVPKALKVGVKAYRKDVGLYTKVTFDRSFSGRNTWLVYDPDIKMLGTEPENKPHDSNAPRNKELGNWINLPGQSSKFYLNQPVIANGHFMWGEATHGGTRIPANGDVVNGIIRVARSLEEVRSLLGNRPMHINSWYRDPATNRAIGGASQSRHMSGDAVDFVIDGIHPYDVYDKLNDWWGNGGGLASASCFTHLDVRGYEARWSYGF